MSLWVPQGGVGGGDSEQPLPFPSPQWLPDSQSSVLSKTRNPITPHTWLDEQTLLPDELSSREELSPDLLPGLGGRGQLWLDVNGLCLGEERVDPAEDKPNTPQGKYSSEHESKWRLSS